jgi:hypothetical protein
VPSSPSPPTSSNAPGAAANHRTEPRQHRRRCIHATSRPSTAVSMSPIVMRHFRPTLRPSPALSVRRPPTQLLPARHGHDSNPPKYLWQGLLPAERSQGKSHKEALRCVKRRLSDAVYRQLLNDATRMAVSPGGHSSSDRPLPEPTGGQTTTARTRPLDTERRRCSDSPCRVLIV